MKKIALSALFFVFTLNTFSQLNFIQTTTNSAGAIQDITHTKTLSIGHTNTLNWGQARLNLYNKWGNWMSLVDGYKNDVYTFANPNNGGRMELFIHDGETNKNNWGVFTVRRDGNIGMGTTNPLAKLHVNGDIKGKMGTFEAPSVELFNPNQDWKLNMKHVTALNVGHVLDVFSDGYEQRQFSFLDFPTSMMFNMADKNNRARFRYAADVGGKSDFNLFDKDQKVIWNVYERGEDKIMSMPTANAKFRIRKNGWYLPDETLVVGGNSTFEGNVTSTGKIGIGTSDLQEKLQIGKAVTFHDGGHKIISFQYSPGGTNKDLDATKYAAEVRFDPTLGNLRLGTSSTITNGPKTHMYITKDGNVGIGSEAKDPNYKLSVKGKVRAREVTVYTSWADYVFETDYNLPTLKEVENHIKENGHLKNIPSAKEVAKEGVKLGEINAKLLEKIEELTLYTISQEKKIAKQEERLQKLEQLLLSKQNKN